MPFNNENQEYINTYLNEHLPDINWFEEQFDFIDNDEVLKKRLAQEFFSTRLIYKFLEGLAVGIDSHLSAKQVRLQIISYASK